MKKRYISTCMVSFLLTAGLCGCTAVSSETASEAVKETTSVSSEEKTTETTSEAVQTNTAVTQTKVSSGGALDTSSLFTERDLTQTADLSGAEKITVQDGQNVEITKEGVYVLSGTASEVTVKVNADDTAKVQIVLDGVTITNTSSPCIYVVSADKVFVTTTDSENSLSVTGTFRADGTTNTDAVIFSKDDLVLNGTGTLTIQSSDNGISGKDDLKITGGKYVITSASDAIEANDSVLIADGDITITSGKDGIHAENDDDNSLGYIYICGGTFNIDAEDDGVQATTICQIDDGTLTVNSSEGIEGTWVQINGGTISLSASDDGINASNKSASYSPVIEINGGDITVIMAAGDTDALDSNGDLYINGGTVDITAQFAFDYVGKAELNGGTVTVNGTEVTQITNSMMGGGMNGGTMPQDGGMNEGDFPQGGPGNGGGFPPGGGRR